MAVSWLGVGQSVGEVPSPVGGVGLRDIRVAAQDQHVLGILVLRGVSPIVTPGDDHGIGRAGVHDHHLVMRALVAHLQRHRNARPDQLGYAAGLAAESLFTVGHDSHVHAAPFGCDQRIRQRAAGKAERLHQNLMPGLAYAADDHRLGIVPGRERHLHRALRRNYRRRLPQYRGLRRLLLCLRSGRPSDQKNEPEQHAAQAASVRASTNHASRCRRPAAIAVGRIPIYPMGPLLPAHAAFFASSAAKKPSVPCTCGARRRYSPVSSAMRCCASAALASRSSNCACAARKASTTSAFSSSSRLQVAYSSKPPGFTSLAAAARIASCFARYPASAVSFWRHLRSGLRRSVPRPVQGASTSTRSSLPARRFRRASFSFAIHCGCTLERPERARRGFRPARRFSDMSKAYSLPLPRIMAPSARVLPPAPAQKSATISPRRGASSWHRIWLPSSWISIAPSRNSACRLICGLPSRRMPTDE